MILSLHPHMTSSLCSHRRREFWVSLPLLIRTLPIILRPHHLASYAREARGPQVAGGNEWQAVDLYSYIPLLSI